MRRETVLNMLADLKSASAQIDAPFALHRLNLEQQENLIVTLWHLWFGLLD